MNIKIEIKGKEYKVNLNNLYKERVDNNLSTQELIEKYESRILNGTL